MRIISRWLPAFAGTALLLALFLPHTPLAQTLSLDLGKSGGTATGKILQLIAITTVLSLAPSILMMVTSFHKEFSGGNQRFLIGKTYRRAGFYRC